MRVTLSSSTLTTLQKVITGDNLPYKEKSIAPYQMGGELVSFFGAIPGLDVSHISLAKSSRWMYVEEVLAAVNGTEIIKAIIESALSPQRFLHTDFSIEDAVAYLNSYLEYDGFALAKLGNFYRLQALDPGVGVATSLATPVDQLSHAYIVEQLEKGERRLRENDFDGAITSARVLVEGMLRTLDQRLPGDPTDAKGDLQKLYKGVARKLNLDPEMHDAESIKQILRGFTNIINGLASLRNNMGDAHPYNFKPQKHHARLAMNAAKTTADFLSETYWYQRSKSNDDVQ